MTGAVHAVQWHTLFNLDGALDSIGGLEMATYVSTNGSNVVSSSRDKVTDCTRHHQPVCGMH